MTAVKDFQRKGTVGGCVLGVWHQYALVVWTQPASEIAVEALNVLSDELAAKYPANFSAIHYAVPGVALPDANGRKALSDALVRYRESLRSAAIVIESSGFWASAIRSFVTGLSLVSGMKVDVRVFSSIPAAAEFSVKKHGDPPEAAQALTSALTAMLPPPRGA